MSVLTRLSIPSRQSIKAARCALNNHLAVRNFAVSSSVQNVEKDTDELIAKARMAFIVMFVMCGNQGMGYRNDSRLYRNAHHASLIGFGLTLFPLDFAS